MKRRALALTAVLTAAMLLSACGSKKEAAPTAPVVTAEPIPVEKEAEETAAETETEPVEESREGMYRSELTNEWIDESLKDQRPIAVMVDNETTALPHFGVNSADIVYEMMNSTMNGRITRLMCVMKDYSHITQLGSVRSTRPTNVMVAAEYNAILCHDGGPFYIDAYMAKDYIQNLSGGFARFSNGKSAEFTEYITSENYKNPTTGKSYDGLLKRIKDSGYSTTYTSTYPGEHFQFSDEELDLSTMTNAKAATAVDLPFPHNSSKLKYNDGTQTYDYYEYGKEHVDAGDGNAVTTFKNAIIYSCDFLQYDEHGYLCYYIVGQGEGYYLTNGQAIPITWSKGSEGGLTEFKVKATGEALTMNTGKTYIAIVPEDSWSDLTIK